MSIRFRTSRERKKESARRLLARARSEGAAVAARNFCDPSISVGPGLRLERSCGNPSAKVAYRVTLGRESALCCASCCARLLAVLDGLGYKASYESLTGSTSGDFTRISEIVHGTPHPAALRNSPAAADRGDLDAGTSRATTPTSASSGVGARRDEPGLRSQRGPR